jgi:cell division protein FtsL
MAYHKGNRIHLGKIPMSPRKYTRNEKIFYILSLLIVFSMVLSLIYVAITPAGL